MIKKFNIFENIEWYQDGEFVEDDENISKFEIGDIIKSENNLLIFLDGDYHRSTPISHVINLEKTNWETINRTRIFIITDTTEVEDFHGYTGQMVKLKDCWPWFQTTNLKLK